MELRNINIITLPLSLLVFTLLLTTTTNAQSTCSTYSFRNNLQFNNCNDLPELNAFLHWTYNATSTTANIAYRVTNISLNSNWIAWALNPTGSGMIGSQALVAYRNSSGAMHAYTSSVADYAITLAQTNISFQVSNLTAISTSSEMIIFATIIPPNTTMNQVWQVGPMSRGSPLAHISVTGSSNVRSFGTINFLNSDQTTAS